MLTKKFLFIITFILFYAAQMQASAPVAVIIKSRGKVFLYHEKENKPRLIKKGQVLYSGDKIRTAAASSCAIKFIDDKSLLRVKESSSCIIEGNGLTK